MARRKKQDQRLAVGERLTIDASPGRPVQVTAIDGDLNIGYGAGVGEALFAGRTHTIMQPAVVVRSEDAQAATVRVKS